MLDRQEKAEEEHQEREMLMAWLRGDVPERSFASALRIPWRPMMIMFLGSEMAIVAAWGSEEEKTEPPPSTIHHLMRPS
jgi:hypothetical protein